jgi:hypothetical protein
VRTTVTLDPDVAARLQAVSRERGISFKEALNAAVRAGLAAGSATSQPYRMRTRAMRRLPGVDLDRALALAGELEDAEIARKLDLRK